MLRRLLLLLLLLLYLLEFIVGGMPKEFTTQLNVYVSVNHTLGLLVYGGTAKKKKGEREKEREREREKSEMPLKLP